MLALDQVGVPVSIAMRLTYPERVTHFNLWQLHAAVLRGTGELGGALYVERQDGERFDLAFVASLQQVAAKLAPGDIVERMLRDNDVVIMNRQPSLHKMSMMAHRVKILAHSTFRLNLSVTTPYNAVSGAANPPCRQRVARIGPVQYGRPVLPDRLAKHLRVVDASCVHRPVAPRVAPCSNIAVPLPHDCRTSMGTRW